LTSPSLLELLTNVGALKEGHFLLASGRHSGRYVEKFDLLRNPVATSDICRGITERFRNEGINVVAGPTTGGILLAFEVGRQLGVAAAYAERAGAGSDERVFKRGTTFESGSRVLVVDDILTTGGSIRETLAALEREPVTVVGIAVLVDRSGGTVRFGETPLFALTTLDVETWTAAECPLCASGTSLTIPGSTAAK
jgi:orotate phosphoribosyltransferase